MMNTFAAIAAISALVLSIFALGLSVGSLWLQLQHRREATRLTRERLRIIRRERTA